MYNLITRIIGWKTIVKLHHFYLLNLWNILLGGLGNNTVNFSSKTSLEVCWTPPAAGDSIQDKSQI